MESLANGLRDYQSMPGRQTILAIIVLYRVPAEASQSFCSLRSLMASDPQAAAAVDLMLVDNSPEAQPRPAEYTGPYIVNPANPGLAASYNLALQSAQRQGIPWLMLLDQDTTLTPDYLTEVFAQIDNRTQREEIVALVPRLTDGGVLCSPIHPPAFGPARPIADGAAGVSTDRLHAFNSGAVLRVTAVAAMGGFAEEFPIDYLDHSTFAALQDRGGSLYVLNATLQHELSSSHEGRTDLAFTRRQAGILDAEYRFYDRFGSAGDRWKRRLRLLRACAGRVLRRKDAGQTWRMLKSALRP
jgi:GT2 family glycosyltransferase